MTVSVKKGGSYGAVTGILCKKNGTYSAVVGAFVKVGGAYQSVLSGGGGTAVAPTISGSPVVDQPVAYTSSETVYGQQWTLDGVDVPGATAATFSQAIADSAKQLRVRISTPNGNATSLPSLPGVRNLRLANTVVARSILSSNDGLFLLCGDSYEAGFGAAGDGTYGETNLKASAISSRWAAAMTAAGFNTSNTSYFGSGRFSNDTPAKFMAMDPRWNVGANMTILDQTVYPTFGGGLIGPSTNVAHAAQVMTFTPGGTFDTVDMYCARSVTAGSMEVSVDGGVTPLQTVAFANGGAAGSGDMVKVTVTVPAGSTAVTFKYAQGSPTGSPFLAGVETRTAAAPKIRFVNGARSGTTVFANAAAPTTVANSGAYVPRAVMQRIAAGITKGVLVLNGWYNDQSSSRILSQITGDYDTLCNEAKARGWEIWYVGYANLDPASISTANLNAFDDGVANHLINNHNAVVFQNKKVFTDFATNTAQGYFYDNLHLGPTGHQKWAESMTTICKIAASGQMGA